jgi:hypothetical protein
MRVESWYKGIQSPLARKWLEGVSTNTITGGVFGGITAVGDNDETTSFWDGVGTGAKRGVVTGTISGIGQAVQYSLTNHVNLLTGKYSKPLYHYTSTNNADEIMKSQLGITEDSWVYLTPDGTKTPIQAQLDLSLPQDNTAESLIMVKPNSIYPSDILLQRNVTGNVFGRGGGGYKIIYKGTINSKHLLRLR